MGAVHEGGSFSFRHSTAQPDQIRSGLCLGNDEATTGNAAAVSRKEFNLSVNVSAGPVSKNRLHQKMFPFSLLIVGDIGLVEKQTRITKA